MPHEDLLAAIRTELATMRIRQEHVARETGQHYSYVSLQLAGLRSIAAPGGVRTMNFVNRKIAERLGQPARNSKSFSSAAATFGRLQVEIALQRAADAADKIIATQGK